MLYKIIMIIVLLLLSSYCFAQETITVFNQQKETIAIGQTDTSRTIDLLDVSKDYYNGLMSIHVNIDSFQATFNDDSVIVWMDRLVGNTWVPSDSITWYVANIDSIFASNSKIITQSHKGKALVAWDDATATSITKLKHLPMQFVRFRKKSVNLGGHNFLLQIIPY